MLKKTLGILSVAIAASGAVALPVAQAASLTATQIAACNPKAAGCGAKPGCGAKANPCASKASASGAKPCGAKPCGAKANPCAAKK